MGREEGENRVNREKYSLYTLITAEMETRKRKCRTERGKRISFTIHEIQLTFKQVQQKMKVGNYLQILSIEIIVIG